MDWRARIIVTRIWYQLLSPQAFRASSDERILGGSEGTWRRRGEFMAWAISDGVRFFGVF